MRTVLQILLSNSSNQPIYEQISSQIKAQIINGSLPEGSALPSMRLLARELHISVITTKRAYEDLERDGFVETVAGKGTFVAQRNLQLIQEEQRRQVEGLLLQAVQTARGAGLSLEELREMLGLLFAGEE